MTFVTDNISTKINSTSLALGFFDGIHKGHQKVLCDAIEYSKKLGTESTVLTFKNHPVEILYGVIPEFITTEEERIAEFKKLGFDNIIMADFTKEIAAMSAEEYFSKIILNLNPKSISIGYNHKFGAKQSGDIDFLNQKSEKYDFILSVSSPVKQKNEVTSSTIIRNAIKIGDVNKANNLLGKPYSIKNEVIHGKQRGREIDFPTANISFPDKKIIPKFGVYSGIATVKNNSYKAIANIGLRPTFGDLSVPIAEVHILNFSKDIYCEILTFEFFDKIRDEIKFPSIEKLKEQIKKDIASF